MQPRSKLLIGAMTLLLLTAAAIPDAPLDGSSTVTAEFRQVNVPVTAQFRKFTGSVHYDPKKIGADRAHIEIDMNSLDVGSEDYNAEVRQKEWLDSAKYPVAIFQLSTITPKGTNRFQAAGELNLKGKTQALVVPVTLTSTGGFDIFDGSVPISRSHFSIGDARWADTIADQVMIKFHIVAPAVR